MIVTTTLTPALWALVRRLVMSAEFHSVQPESAAKVPSPLLTWSPNTATVERSEKFQLGYPMVGSARLLRAAKPKASPCGPPPGVLAAGFLGAAVRAFRG